MPDVAHTLGALFVGGFVAALFSGVVSVQSFIYFKYYPADHPALKLLVFASWFLDLSHTGFIGCALWNDLIVHFGERPGAHLVPWSLALTIVLTAVLTFLVHCFFVYRIYRLSEQKLYIAIPLAIIATARLFFACLTTSMLIHLGSLKAFVEQYKWSFTCGLGLSSLLDVLITFFLCSFLMNGRKKNSSLCPLLDTLMLYTFECGALTCAATVVSMICWLTMPKNLIFMGLHFIISKFYANSLLATLNTRGLHSMPNSSLSRSCSTRTLSTSAEQPKTSSRLQFLRMNKGGATSRPLQINVEESVTRTIDESTVVETSSALEKDEFSFP